VVHCALRLLPEPPSDTAVHPEIELPPSVKLTVPVGPNPFTVAVNVTLAPAAEGLTELVNAVVLVVVGGLLTTCESVALLDAELLASPP